MIGKSGFKRTQRLNDLVRNEVADILMKRVKDPRIGFVTVSAVDISPDLRHAKVYVSVLEQISSPEKVLEGLKKASPFVRGELGRRCHYGDRYHAGGSFQRGCHWF